MDLIKKLQNGVRTGKGITYFKEGGVYKGEWKDGRKDGKGIYIYNDG